MPTFSCPLGSCLGSEERMAIYVKTERLSATSFRARIRPKLGFGDAWWQIYNNAVFVKTVYIYEGTECVLPIIPNPGAANISVCAIYLGQSNFPGLDLSAVARTFEMVACQRVTIDWQWEGDVFDSDDTAMNTTNWMLTGLSRLNTVMIPTNKKWSYITFDLNVSAGIATVNVKDSLLDIIATGTAPVNSLLTLTQNNASGVSGSVYINPFAVSLSNIQLTVRWPKQMNILRGPTNTPSTSIASVPFDGNTFGDWTEPADLSSGTYYYQLQAQSEQGKVGPASPVQQEIIRALPVAPTNIARLSGNAANIVLSFTPSVTPFTSYNAYLGDIGNFIDVDNSAGTAVVNSTSIALTTPITGYPGTAYVLIRGNLISTGGGEEKNGNVYRLDFDASGNFIGPPPNVPTINPVSIAYVSGRTVSLQGIYPTADELGTGVSLRWFSRTKTGTYDFTSPLTSGALSAITTGLKGATLTYTYPADGVNFVVFCAVSNNGILGAPSNEVEVVPDSNAMPAALDVVFSQSPG